MPAKRRARRLPAPPPDLAGFPALRLSGARLYRIHRSEQSPWWFSSDGSGRFDLPAGTGRGTCYLAGEPTGAFLEVFRYWTVVPEVEVAARRISHLPVPAVILADCTSPQSRRLGLTAEIHSAPDYETTQRWSAAFAAAGFGGVRYYLRHDPSQRLIGVAIFGPAGSPAWPVAAAETLSDDLLARVERRFGIRVLPATASPPATR